MLAKKRQKFPKLGKSPRQLERHLKGVANHRRIEILFLIARNKEITLEKITERLNGNIKTISVHTQKLVQAGLVQKNNRGREVTHVLSPYGKIIHNFLETF